MSLQFVIDMNLSPRWVSTFLAAGHAVVHWLDVGDRAASDVEIMAWAVANQCVVFTHDLDFGQLLALTKATGPSVVQLRSEVTIPRIVGFAVLTAVGMYEAELAAGALVVVEPSRSRVRILPF